MKNKAGIKRTLVTDRQLPTPEQVNKRQDFSRVNNNYTLIKKVMLKNTLLWSGGIIGAAGIAAAVVFNQLSAPAVQPKAPEQKVAEAKANPCILSPFPAAEEPFSTFTVSGKAGATLQYKTGSSITISANAFVDATGNPISDSVTIRYREFHDALDIFLSGIPMNYDSAGTKYTLESAGMLEIRGFQNGKAVQLDPNKPLTINMASNSAEKNFNLYQLDTIHRNWDYKGKDQVSTAAKTDTPVAKAKPATAPAPANTVKPVLSDPQKYCFKIGYNKNEFPELAAYDNVLFEVTDNAFKPVYYKINWKSISLENSSTKGTYLVKLHKADTTITVSAVPVFDEDHYESAMQIFDAKLKAQNDKQGKTEAQQKAKVQEVDQSLSHYNNSSLMNVANALTTATRTFRITAFGIHNCDRPLPPSPMQIMAWQFAEEDRAAAQVTNGTIYLVEKGKNTVFRF